MLNATPATPRGSKTCSKECTRSSVAYYRARSCRLEAKASFSELVTVTLLFTFTLRCLNADLLVVLLKGCEIFTSLAELTLLHSFADVVVNERTLGVHQIELVVNAGHHFRNRCAVRYHAARAHHLGQITTRDNRRRLVVDSALEAGRAPVDKLDRALRLDRRNRGVHIL